jgi:hypothetical protein
LDCAYRHGRSDVFATQNALHRFGSHFSFTAKKPYRVQLSIYLLASASRFCFAQSLSGGTAFMGGPPLVPHAHGPSILASVMQKQDFVFRQAQT